MFLILFRYDFAFYLAKVLIILHISGNYCSKRT